MKLGADVLNGVAGGLEDCGRTAMTGINSIFHFIFTWFKVRE